MHRFARVKAWHGVVVAVALLAIFGLCSLVLGHQVVVRNYQQIPPVRSHS